MIRALPKLLYLPSAVSGTAVMVANTCRPVDICSGPSMTAQTSTDSPSVTLYTIRSNPIRISTDALSIDQQSVARFIIIFGICM